ncbi:hypothetical protein E4T47_08529 [Aureobasidium subglaciale]|nr:hypothetical protein E4T47_08529 [Aureobasidium subglaciale]
MAFSFNPPGGSSSGSTPSLFGSTAPKPGATTGPSLFGNTSTAPTSGGFNFGNPTASGAAPAASPFGAPSPTTQPAGASGFSFASKAPEKQGSNPTTPGVAATGNPFSGAPASTGGMFGNNSTTPAAATTGAMFGNNSTTPAATNKPMFSTTPAGPPPTQSTGGFFGGAGAKPSVGLFSQKPEEKTGDAPKPAPAFGSAFNSALGGGGGAPSLFSGQKAADAPKAAPVFGSVSKQDESSTSSAAPSLFAQKPAEGAPASKPMFGATSSTPQAAPPAFPSAGNSSKPAFSLTAGTSQPPASTQPASAVTSAPSGGLFSGMGGGSSSAAPASTGTSAPMFGAKKDDGAAKPAANLFSGMGQNKDAADKPASALSFGGLGANKDEAAKPATPTGGLFSGMGTNKDETTKPAAPAGGLFGGLGGAKKDDGATSSSAATPTSTNATSGLTPAFSLGAKPADSSTPASTGASAFSLKPAAGPTAGSSPGGSGPTSGGGNNNSGGLTGSAGATGLSNSSTSGPAPPATSRLNSKSLDEIITLWTTSLSSHQKQFSNLATKIGSWDRMLVENSDKISKLYSRTFQAERDTAEVERQLASVEGQQEELSHWLDHYERVLDDMAAKAGGVDSGVDAERERTYRTAERCSTRLTTMSHDLTSMIEEINLASTNLSNSSKTAESDPLSQIVRVLNAHLGQLQQIDVGAEQLRQKVESAQKEVRGFGGRVDDGGVEGFMRSLRR